MLKCYTEKQCKLISCDRNKNEDIRKRMKCPISSILFLIGYIVITNDKVVTTFFKKLVIIRDYNYMGGF